MGFEGLGQFEEFFRFHVSRSHGARGDGAETNGERREEHVLLMLAKPGDEEIRERWIRRRRAAPVDAREQHRQAGVEP